MMASTITVQITDTSAMSVTIHSTKLVPALHAVAICCCCCTTSGGNSASIDDGDSGSVGADDDGDDVLVAVCMASTLRSDGGGHSSSPFGSCSSTVSAAANVRVPALAIIGSSRKARKPDTDWMRLRTPAISKNCDGNSRPSISTVVNGVASPPRPSRRRATTNTANEPKCDEAACSAAPPSTSRLATSSTGPGPMRSMARPPMSGPIMAAP
mmetsp:Transcript_1957/g.4589  ORF Transcript_1957/g.4589 Transcript_1957/m.4589 type:complete len:212 (+) Transcript_1957:286-921(+)